MARRPLTKPRKHAAQDRSRATVNALIEATAHILVKEGFDKASTNRIAQRAGVSIGSLYQYYPTKEALVVAVIERHHEDLMQVVRAAVSGIDALPLEQGIRRLVRAGIDGHRVDPALHRALTEQIPRMGRLGNVDAYNHEAHGLARDYLEARREEIRVVDLDMAAFVVATSVEALTHTAVLRQSEVLDGLGADALVDEVTHLVLRYLMD